MVPCSAPPPRAAPGVAAESGVNRGSLDGRPAVRGLTLSDARSPPVGGRRPHVGTIRGSPGNQGPSSQGCGPRSARANAHEAGPWWFSALEAAGPMESVGYSPQCGAQANNGPSDP